MHVTSKSLFPLHVRAVEPLERNRAAHGLPAILIPGSPWAARHTHFGQPWAARPPPGSPWQPGPPRAARGQPETPLLGSPWAARNTTFGQPWAARGGPGCPRAARGQGLPISESIGNLGKLYILAGQDKWGNVQSGKPTNICTENDPCKTCESHGKESL